MKKISTTNILTKIFKKKPVKKIKKKTTKKSIGKVIKKTKAKAKTASFTLPLKISKLIKEGYQLGDADDIVFKRSNSKQKNGAVGILTKNLINRTDYYVHAIILALIPFTNSKLY